MLASKFSKGEVLGLIGRNGAGKSTLAEDFVADHVAHRRAGRHSRPRTLASRSGNWLPSRTHRPGKYFPERRDPGHEEAEIQAKFDEIVAFAEVEKFIDTPVKRFSSGMYLRLAFAVAAHLVSEILLVDEVLAVGDAAFQKKCLGKMNEVAHEGRTVLFVSHNMAAVRTLCTRGICLEQGRIVSSGDIEHVLYRYTQSQMLAHQNPSGSQTRISAIQVNGQNPGTIESGETFEVSCTLELAAQVPSFRLFCIVQDANGDAVIVVPSNSRVLATANQPGVHQISVRFPTLWLRPGVYSVYFKLLAVSAGAGDARFLSDSIMLDVAGDDDPEKLLAILAPDVNWEITDSILRNESVGPLAVGD